MDNRHISPPIKQTSCSGPLVMSRVLPQVNKARLDWRSLNNSTSNAALGTRESVDELLLKLEKETSFDLLKGTRYK